MPNLSPIFYDPAGVVVDPKVWEGAVVISTGVSVVVDISSAGFTTTPVVAQATGFGALGQVVVCDIMAISATSVTVRATRLVVVTVLGISVMAPIGLGVTTVNLVVVGK